MDSPLRGGGEGKENRTFFNVFFIFVIVLSTTKPGDGVLKALVDCPLNTKKFCGFPLQGYYEKFTLILPRSIWPAKYIRIAGMLFFFFVLVNFFVPTGTIKYHNILWRHQTQRNARELRVKLFILNRGEKLKFSIWPKISLQIYKHLHCFANDVKLDGNKSM